MVGDLIHTCWGIPQRSSHPFVCQRQQVSFFINIINVDCGQFKRRITRKLKNVALKVCSVPNAPLKKTSLVALNKIVSHLLLDAQLKLSQEPMSNVFSLSTGATFFQENTRFSFPSLKTPTASDLKKRNVCRTSLSMKGKCTTQHSPNWIWLRN